METVVQPPADAELHLLTEWSEPGRRERTRAAAVGSLLAHIVIILVLMALPAYVPPHEEPVRRTVTPLIEPLTELTQKAPNTAKVTKEFNAVESTPRPRLSAPQSAPPAPRAAVIPPMPPPKAVPQPPPPELPKVEATARPEPKIDLPPSLAPTLPPQIQTEEKAKSPFENVAPPPTGVPAARRQVPIPGSPVDEAVRQAARNNASGATGIGGSGSIGMSQTPTQGSRIELPQLLSDSMGVDFRAYLSQILATVRRNWMAVMPESVRLGRRGQVAIQFSIARDGKVPKLVIASSSGTEALDRTAISGISASSPFPPLPGEFKGERIVVQFNFSYNMPKQ